MLTIILAFSTGTTKNIYKQSVMQQDDHYQCNRDHSQAKRYAAQLLVG